jgi:DnaJ family protein C protein 13
MQFSALEVIAASIGNKDCVANIAESNVLAYLLVSLETLPKGRTLSVEIMHGLTSNPKMLVEILKSGALLYVVTLLSAAHPHAIPVPSGHPISTYVYGQQLPLYSHCRLHT